MKNEIFYYYFYLVYDPEFNFLNLLNSEKEIHDKVDLVVRKMMMHEQEDGLQNIIEEYLCVYS